MKTITLEDYGNIELGFLNVFIGATEYDLDNLFIYNKDIFEYQSSKEGDLFCSFSEFLNKDLLEHEKHDIKEIILNVFGIDLFEFNETDHRHNYYGVSDGYMNYICNIAAIISNQLTYHSKIIFIKDFGYKLDPKLARQFTMDMAAMAAKYDKHIIAVTNAPTVLDGINLNDNEQRLFVVERTTIKRYIKPIDTGIKMSEAYLNGFIGGLSKGFRHT